MIQNRVIPWKVAKWCHATRSLVLEEILVTLTDNDLRCLVKDERGNYSKLLPNSEPCLITDDTDGEIISDFTIVRSTVDDWNLLFVLTDSGIQVKVFEPQHIGNFSPKFAFAFAPDSEKAPYYFLACDGGGNLLVKSFFEESTWLIDIRKILELPLSGFHSADLNSSYGATIYAETATHLIGISRNINLYAFDHGIAGYITCCEDPKEKLGIADSFFHPYWRFGSWEGEDSYQQHRRVLFAENESRVMIEPEGELLAISTKIWACRDLIYAVSPSPGMVIIVRVEPSREWLQRPKYIVELLLEKESALGIQGKVELLYENKLRPPKLGEGAQAVHSPGRKFWTCEFEKLPSIKGCRVWKEEKTQVEIFYEFEGEKIPKGGPLREEFLHHQRLERKITPDY